MNRRLGGDASLNAPIREDGDSGEWQDWLADDSESQETVMAEHEELDNRRKALSSALDVLNDRERRIFEARRLADDPVTLEELAEEFGVSRERVRQIEVRAFEKVQKAVKNQVAAMETPPAQRRSDRRALKSATQSTSTKRRRKAAFCFVRQRLCADAPRQHPAVIIRTLHNASFAIARKLCSKGTRRISRDSDSDPCPVPDEMLGELYRASKAGLPELIATVSPDVRAALALYCYRRGHLKGIGLAIASTCDLVRSRNGGRHGRRGAVRTLPGDHADGAGRRRPTSRGRRSRSPAARCARACRSTKRSSRTRR